MKLLTDKRLVQAAIATAVVWLGALAMIWGWVLDASGLTMLLTLTAAMLAVATVARVAAPLLRLARWVLALLGRPTADVLGIALVRDGRGHRASGAALLGMFGAATELTLAGGLISTVGAFLAGRLVDLMAGHFGWTPISWGLFQLFLQWLTFLPIAAGIAALLATGAIIRRDSRPNRLATISRESLSAVAAGLAVFATAWWAGLSVLILAGLAAMGLLTIAWLSTGGKDLTTPSRGFKPSPATQTTWQPRLRIFATFAVLALVLATQMRLLGDLVGLSMAGRSLWSAGSLVLLAAVLRRVDHGRQQVDLTESSAAAIGMVFAVAMQMALAFVYLSTTWGGLLAGASAAAIQLPLVMLAGRLIVRQRRLFVTDGGPTADFLALAAAGVAVGLLLHVSAGLAQLNWVIPIVAVGLGVGAVAAGALRLPSREARRLWIASTSVLLIVSVIGVRAAAALDDGRPIYGVWLRTLVRPAGPSRHVAGALPTARAWRSGAVTDVMHDILDPADKPGHGGHGGRWWVVVSSLSDRPDTPEVYSALSMPDTSALSADDTDGPVLLGAEGPYLLAAMIGTERFDGILLAPLAADHPDAWRCYNVRTLRRCYRRVLADQAASGSAVAGAMMLRTQVAVENRHDAFRVVRTFLDVVGDSWAVVAWDHGMVDVLVAGPKTRDGRVVIERPTPQGGAFVISAEHFWPADTRVRPIRLLAPRGPFRPASLRASRWYYHIQRWALRD